MSNVKLLFQHETSEGMFYIGLMNGRYHIYFDEDIRDGYATPQQAAEALHHGVSDVGSHTDSLGFPQSLEGWESYTPL